MKNSTKICLGASTLLLVAVGYLALASHVFQGCGAALTTTELKVRESFKVPLHKFKTDVGRYPTTEEGLASLLLDPGIDGWNGPYILREEDTLDAWYRTIQYRSPGRYNRMSYDMFSYGPDGIESDDDIKNWNRY